MFNLALSDLSEFEGAQQISILACRHWRLFPGMNCSSGLGITPSAYVDHVTLVVQLPPVSRSEVKFAFEARMWKESIACSVNLTQVGLSTDSDQQLRLSLTFLNPSPLDFARSSDRRTRVRLRSFLTSWL